MVTIVFYEMTGQLRAAGCSVMSRVNEPVEFDSTFRRGRNGFPPNPNRIFPLHFGTFCIFLGSGMMKLAKMSSVEYSQKLKKRGHCED
jgi:hypothetical protein